MSSILYTQIISVRQEGLKNGLCNMTIDGYHIIGKGLGV